MRTRVAGEIRDFHAGDFMTEKLARRTDRFQHLAIAAAHMALDDARFQITTSNCDRVGTSLGTAVGGLETTLDGHKMFLNGGAQDITPFFVPMLLTGMGSAQVAIHLGAKGPCFSPTTGCAASTHAIGDSFRLIQRGDADAMFTGGCDAAIVPLLVHMLGKMNATTARTDDPKKASRPFDAERDGFVPSEGSGVVLLEEMEQARRRGAHIYAELLGYGASEDAYHPTSVPPGGEGAVRCMRLALADAGVRPEEIDYINAHGTSTKMNDATETEALKVVFGERARAIPASSNKSMIGHSWGASGGIEAIFTVLTLETGIVPPTVNLEFPDPRCDLDYVPNVARKVNVRTAISNSFGFGGTNGVLVFRKWEGK